MKGDPGTHESSAGSVTVQLEILELPAVQAQLPLCPDWPDLN